MIIEFLVTSKQMTRNFVNHYILFGSHATLFAACALLILTILWGSLTMVELSFIAKFLIKFTINRGFKKLVHHSAQTKMIPAANTYSRLYRA